MSLATLALSLAALGAPHHGDGVELRLADDVRLEVRAHWEPAVRSMYGLFRTNRYLKDLAPAQDLAVRGAAELRPLLPPRAVEVGETWRVPIEPIVHLLSQLHPGAQAELHHGFGAAPGAWACLRAVDGESAEILIRAHAEIRLDPDARAYFTPSQFEGRLVVDRTDGTVDSLRLGVPPRDTNVDVNVPTALGGAADIGFVPRMELVAGDEPERDWEQAVSLEDARRRLALRFYRFARVEYLPFEEAVARSAETGRPLHVVALFGSLDDESC